MQQNATFLGKKFYPVKHPLNNTIHQKGDFKMELIIGLIVVAVAVYFIFFRKSEQAAEVVTASVAAATAEVVTAPVAVKKPTVKKATTRTAKPAAKKAPAKKAPAKKAPAKK